MGLIFDRMHDDMGELQYVYMSSHSKNISLIF